MAGFSRRARPVWAVRDLPCGLDWSTSPRLSVSKATPTFRRTASKQQTETEGGAAKQEKAVGSNPSGAAEQP